MKIEYEPIGKMNESKQPEDFYFGDFKFEPLLDCDDPDTGMHTCWATPIYDSDKSRTWMYLELDENGKYRVTDNGGRVVMKMEGLTFNSAKKKFLAYVELSGIESR